MNAKNYKMADQSKKQTDKAPVSKRPARNSMVRGSANGSPPPGGSADPLTELDVKPSFDIEEMKRMEDEFQKILKQLLSAPSLAQFKTEYEKLHRNMKKSYENEIKMMDKCRELHADILSNAARISTATRLAQEDSVTIKNLKREIEKAWRLLDESHAKEDRAGETIVTLKKEIHNLTQLIEKNAGFASGQEAGVRELIKARDQLNNQVDRQRQDIDEIKNSLVRSGEREDACRKRILDLEGKKNGLEEQNNFLSSSLDAEKKRRMKLEQDVAQRDEDISSKDLDSRRLNKELEHEREEVARYQAFQIDLRRRLEGVSKEKEGFVHAFEKLKKEFDERLEQTDALQNEIKQLMSEAKVRDEEAQQLKIKLSKQTTAAENAGRRARTLEDQRRDLDAERAALAENNHSQAKEIDAFRQHTHTDRRRIDELIRHQESLEKQVARINQKNVLLHRQVDHVLANESTQKLETHKLVKETHKSRRIIDILLADRDRYKHIINDTRIKLTEFDEQVAEKERTIDELKRVAHEKDQELHDQKNKNEEIRSERNVCLKKLLDSADETDKAKRKLRTILSQLEQAKEESLVKDQGLAREHLDCLRLQNENNKLSEAIASVRQQIIDVRKQRDHLQVESDNLFRIIRQADNDISTKAKVIDRLMAERDLLGTQLINRNDELALIGEKMRLLDTMTQRASVEYQARCNDIRILKVEIKRMRRQSMRFQASCVTLQQLRCDAINLHRDIATERQKCRVLEDELKLPKNGHRWRQLQGRDPSKYELLQKLHHYQRKLIRKTELLVKKDELLNEKERLYIALKERMAKLPGTEVFIEINRLNKMVQHQSKEMRCSSADLNMFEKMFYDERDASKRLEEELIGFKNRYYIMKVRLDKYRHATAVQRSSNYSELKRKLLFDHEHNASAYGKLEPPSKQQTGINVAEDERPLFVGGGFRINTTALPRPMKTKNGEDAMKTNNFISNSRIIHERMPRSAVRNDKRDESKKNQSLDNKSNNEQTSYDITSDENVKPATSKLSSVNATSRLPALASPQSKTASPAIQPLKASASPNDIRKSDQIEMKSSVHDIDNNIIARTSSVG